MEFRDYGTSGKFPQEKSKRVGYQFLGVAYAKMNKGIAVNSQSESQLGKQCRADLKPDYIFFIKWILACDLTYVTIR